MSEKKTTTPKKRTVTSASTGKTLNKEELAEAKKQNAKAAQAAAPQQPTGNSTGLRIGAVILWVAAIAFEVIGILAIGKKVPFLAAMDPTAVLIGCIVLDLICLLIGSQLWKRANHISPASEKNKLKFWLWNNLGVIVSVLAFVPFIIVLFTNKQSDGKTKAIAGVAAIIALLIAGVGSYDFNAISKEQVQAAQQETQLQEGVFWVTTPGSRVYHIDQECFTLNSTEELKFGTVQEAIAEDHTRLCYYCAKRHEVSDTVATENIAGEVLEDTTVLEEGPSEETQENTEGAAPAEGEQEEAAEEPAA